MRNNDSAALILVFGMFYLFALALAVWQKLELRKKLEDFEKRLLKLEAKAGTLDK